MRKGCAVSLLDTATEKPGLFYYYIIARLYARSSIRLRFLETVQSKAFLQHGLVIALHTKPLALFGMTLNSYAIAR